MQSPAAARGLNTGRANTLHAIEQDGTGSSTGDKPLLLDDSSG